MVLFVSAMFCPLARPIQAEDSEKVVLSSPQILSYERFLANGADNVAGGLLLLGELNCLSCHKATPEIQALVATKQAPILNHGSSRFNAGYVENLLSDPAHVKPGTTMPDLLSGKSAEERATIAGELAAFLDSIGKPVSPKAPSPQMVREGRKQYAEVGCLACHAPLDDEMAAIAQRNDEQNQFEEEEAPAKNISIPLGNLSVKYRLSGLSEFLQNPLDTRPSARMPHLNLNADEADAIASFLLKDLKVAANTRFEMFEGSWTQLPDFSELKPTQTGESFGLDINQGKKNNFALRFRAFLQIPQTEEYTLHLGSDDGSRLIIDGKRWIDNDAIHPFSMKSESGELTAGAHEIVVEYFEQGGEEQLQVEIESNSLKRQQIDGMLTFDREPVTESDAPSEPAYTEAMIASGQQHFVKLGCANCHQLKDNASTAAFTDFKSLKRAGCLAEENLEGTPNYHLSPPQRTALIAAIDRLQKGDLLAGSAEEQVHRQMLSMNCYACHQRNDFGGVDAAHEPYFAGSQPEMGDEGRLPPLLTGVGAKLRPGYLRKLLAEGANDRPYMLTRMPRFADQGRALADKLLAADKLDVEPVEEPIAERRVKTFGRQLVGEDGLSCIKCHQFGKYNASGIQAMNMATMTQRLDPEWFVEYMLDPNRFRPGTRMPGAWPGGKSFFPDMLDGDPRRQIQAIWAFLADGERAALPAGLEPSKLELVAETEPIIYRNFIEGAGSRAIGVGYPEKLNLAFDANQMRLALIWQGAFIDASRHWNGRGQGFQPPLGDNVLSLPDQSAFAKLADKDQAWPSESAKSMGIHFRGYALDHYRRPTFRYKLPGWSVEDHFVPATIVQSESQLFPLELVRTISLKQLPQDQAVADDAQPGEFYFRISQGADISDDGEGWFTINGDWRVKVESSVAPFIRESSDQRELLVPVDTTNPTQKIGVTYRW
jgi:mono/diheme cytochrome c family protein